MIDAFKSGNMRLETKVEAVEEKEVIQTENVFEDKWNLFTGKKHIFLIHQGIYDYTKPLADLKNEDCVSKLTGGSQKQEVIATLNKNTEKFVR